MKSDRALRVLFLIQHPDLPSSRVRVMDLLPELRSLGIDATCEPFPRGWPARHTLPVWRRCRAADVVVLQKKLPTRFASAWLRRASRRLVYDFDDAVYYRHESSGSLDHPTSRRRFVSLLRRVDLAIAGNRFLAEAAAPLSRRVEVLPSAVETREAPQRRHGPASPLVIGWIGGRINLGQAALLAPVLRTLAAEFPLEYRIISAERLELAGVPTTFVPWTLAGQAAEVARFDIGVMPLPEGGHAAGKCGFKAIQYMSAGVPPVVSRVGINCEIVRDGVDGIVAADLDGFADALRRLAADPALRARLGASARARAEQHYSIHVTAARLARLLREVAA